MYQAGLILEGGAMKGIYTAGVLDFFLEQGITFSSAYGVSAGVLNLCSYLSGQKERSRRLFTNYLGCRKYCSMYNLITTGNLFGTRMCYDLIPNYLDPFDHETFEQYQGKAYAVVTNIRTGEAEYMQLKDMRRQMNVIQASSSMPLVSRNVKIGKELYLDGGISDSIPIGRSIRDGNQKNVIIMTKEEGFRRDPSSSLGLLRLRYAAYPRVYELMRERHLRYNAVQDYICRLEAEGKVFVIRPEKKSAVGRIEKDVSRLKELYQEGYEDGRQCCQDLRKYLSSDQNISYNNRRNSSSV